MPSPIVSIIIPCFNQGAFLREALESVGSPAHPTEIVVVDDGSTDDSSTIATAYAPPDGGAGRHAAIVRCVRQTNAGLAAARNRGLTESRGGYVVFLDADDRLAPDAIDVGAKALEDHPDCWMVFGRSVTTAADGTPLPTPIDPPIETDHYRALLRRNYIWMPAVAMLRREAVEAAGGFNPAVNAAADYELYLTIARQHPVYDHGRIVAYYRRHDANMSGNASRMLRESLAVIRRQRQFVEGDPESLRAYRQGWRAWQEFYGTDLVDEIRAHVAAREWRRAARKVMTLAWYHPRGLAHHAIQKLRVTAGELLRV